MKYLLRLVRHEKHATKHELTFDVQGGGTARMTLPANAPTPEIGVSYDVEFSDHDLAVRARDAEQNAIDNPAPEVLTA